MSPWKRECIDCGQEMDSMTEHTCPVAPLLTELEALRRERDDLNTLATAYGERIDALQAQLAIAVEGLRDLPDTNVEQLEYIRKILAKLKEAGHE